MWTHRTQVTQFQAPGGRFSSAVSMCWTRSTQFGQIPSSSPSDRSDRSVWWTTTGKVTGNALRPTMGPMPNREQRLARATRLIGRDLDEAAEELREARRRGGLTQQVVASAIGVSHQTVLRNEKGFRGISPILLARHAAAVGLRARIKLYPDGEALRDAGQVALIRRFRGQAGDAGHWAFEVPIPESGDQRALDAVLTLPGGRVGIEFYTRLADAQAQLRAANLKKRDARLDRLVVVVQATRANRRALREAGSILTDFPGSGRRIMAAFAAGDLPPFDGVVVF